MAEVYQCSSCPPEEACGLDGESFDRSYDECHHPLTLEKARLYAAADEMYAALKDVMEWIENWSPEFVEDCEWPQSKKRAMRALAKAKRK